MDYVSPKTAVSMAYTIINLLKTLQKCYCILNFLKLLYIIHVAHTLPRVLCPSLSSSPPLPRAPFTTYIASVNFHDIYVHVCMYMYVYMILCYL